MSCKQVSHTLSASSVSVKARCSHTEASPWRENMEGVLLLAHSRLCETQGFNVGNCRCLVLEFIKKIFLGIVQGPVTVFL